MVFFIILYIIILRSYNILKINLLIMFTLFHLEFNIFIKIFRVFFFWFCSVEQNNNKRRFNLTLPYNDLSLLERAICNENIDRAILRFGRAFIVFTMFSQNYYRYLKRLENRFLRCEQKFHQQRSIFFFLKFLRIPF